MSERVDLVESASKPIGLYVCPLHGEWSAVNNWCKGCGGPSGAEKQSSRALSALVRRCVRAEAEAGRVELLDWVQHDSWRCGHPDRYPQDEDCPCGLLAALTAAGIDAEQWRVRA